MSRHFLIPLDGNDQSWAALDHVAEHAPGSTVTVLHVIDPARATYGASAGIPTSSEDWYEAEETKAERLFETAAERAPSLELETALEVGQPSRVIVEYAEEHGVDQIAMGSHGRQGVARVLLGSVAEVVVRRSPVPVTVVR
jgi:nucleotide-binding universal stress UspA family protein